MAVAIPALSAVAGLVGSTSAVTGASILSTGVSAIGGLMQSSYQGAVLRNQAAIETEKAKQARFQGANQAADQGLAARSQIGDMIVGQGSSGVSLSSGSSRRSRRVAAILARRDQGRILEGAQANARSFEENASSFLGEAKAVRMKSIFDLAGNAMSLGGTLITDASMVNRSRARSITREARAV